MGKIDYRNYGWATSEVEDNDWNYVLAGFTSKNGNGKSDVYFAEVSGLGIVIEGYEKAIDI